MVRQRNKHHKNHAQERKKRKIKAAIPVKITINKRGLDEYFGLDTLKQIVRQPLELTESLNKYDIFVNVNGGGTTGQAGAIRHGIARALVKLSEENKAVLKTAGLLTRDPRMKERKKYGLHKARRAVQFSKR